MANLTQLEQRVDRLEEEMEQVKSRQRPERRKFAGIELTDNDELVRLFEDLYRKLGIDISGRPSVSIEELHRRMLADGVRPEERLISSGLRELRGYQEDE